MAIQLLVVLSLFVGPFVSIKVVPAGQQTQKAKDPYKDILGPIPERKLSQRDLGVDYALVTVSLCQSSRRTVHHVETFAQTGEGRHSRNTWLRVVGHLV